MAANANAEVRDQCWAPGCAKKTRPEPAWAVTCEEHILNADKSDPFLDLFQRFRRKRVREIELRREYGRLKGKVDDINYELQTTMREARALKEELERMLEDER